MNRDRRPPSFYFLAAFFGLFILLFSFVPPPINIYQAQEAWRLGGIEKDWVGWDDIAPVMARSVVAAEDANFCLHWGFDMAAIRDAIEDGGGRGASTLSQQVVKNTFLWHGRSWLRKALEAAITPAMELFWSKRRILEVYLNTAEFAEGVFGVQAAAQHHFGADAATLKSLNSRIGASLAELDRLGTLQPGDLARIKEELLDPTSLFTAATTKNSTIRAGYQTLLDTFQRSHDRSLAQYEFWPGLQDFKPAPLPPGFVPEQPK